jgi:outer membrane protein OmpA-like peptidoglycan-associated protein
MTLQRLIFCFLFLISSNTIAQQFYVVIGAFQAERNARNYALYARTKHLDASIDRNDQKGLYYVFAYKTTNHDEAITVVQKLRKETEFKDAWSFNGYLMMDAAISKKDENETPVVNSAPIQEKYESGEEEDEHLAIEADVYSNIKTDSLIISAFENELMLKPRGKLFKFMVTAADGSVIPAEIHAVNRQMGRDLATFSANQYVDVVRVNGLDNLTLVCGVFGYKESEKILSFQDPALTEGAAKDAQGAWVIPFTLDKLNKGDASVMYRVAFYKDAVIMLPQSKSEVDELANLLRSNPDFEITVHGHCNGGHQRKIISLGEQKNYFQIDGSTQINGSAKELSELRAAAIQSYLIKQGIESNRIKTYAWGGSDMLVDEFSANAKLNDRIEIEIMK